MVDKNKYLNYFSQSEVYFQKKIPQRNKMFLVSTKYNKKYLSTKFIC